MKISLQILSLIPFLYFTFQDNLLHFKVRKVSLVENILHLFLGVLLFGFIKGCFLNSFALKKFTIITGLLLLAGSLDEFYFHRNIPLVEVEAHAKAHWSLFLFLGMSLILNFM